MKNKVITLLLLSIFVNCAAVHSLPPLARKKILDHIHQIKMIMNHLTPDYFGFFNTPDMNQRAYDQCLADQKNSIADILKKHGMSYPENRHSSMSWIIDLERKLTPVKPQASYQCDITGLDKKAVLLALYKRSRVGCNVIRLGHFFNDRLRDEELAAALSNLKDIDYVGGRPLKVDISGDTFDAFLYNRENGHNAAQEAIKQLRSK